jgi:signal transduction histidine kinase
VKRLRDHLRSRLALRIYLVGLAQIAAVAVGFHLIIEAHRPPGPGPRGPEMRYVADHVQRVLDDRDALETELRQIETDFRAPVSVVDPDGNITATTALRDVDTCADESRRNEAAGERGCVTTRLRFPDGREGRLRFAASVPGPPPPRATDLAPSGGPPRRPRLGPPHPPPPSPPPEIGTRVVPFVLILVGISSLLLARTLTRPLRKLSGAARAFGRGDLSARAALTRGDELGDVSRAFDEMAERVTELLRAEKELLANVSHELRTPLARIRVALDLAIEGDAEVARESLADIAEDLDELERLIADILAAARLDLAEGDGAGGVPPLRRERVDVHDLLSRASSRFRTAHPNRTLHLDAAEALPSVEGDPMLLRRVIDNLLENAHKYSAQSTDPIDLCAREDAGELAIEVVDRGIGISAEDLPRVFRPFYRADKSRTRATGGLGLGLALAKRIVDAHGGSIDLVSAPDQGTRARVRLPAAR